MISYCLVKKGHANALGSIPLLSEAKSKSMIEDEVSV